MIRDGVQAPPRRQTGLGSTGKAACTIWAHAPSGQDALHRFPPAARRGACRLQGTTVRLSWLHPYLGEIAEQARTWCGKRRRRADLPARWPRSMTGVGPTGITCCAGNATGWLRELKVIMPTTASRGTCGSCSGTLPSQAVVAEMAGATNQRQATHLGSLRRASRTPPASFTHDHASLRQRQRSSCVRNRKREICTSGSVGGEGGTIRTDRSWYGQGPDIAVPLGYVSARRRGDGIAM